MLSSAGLVITRNATDGEEVTHFQITGISRGTLYQHDGVTVISGGQFLTVAEGQAGLRFRPAPDSVAPGSFLVQASRNSTDAGLGGAPAVATIAVQPVNDSPTFTGSGDVVVQDGLGPQTARRWATNMQAGPADEAGQRLWFEVTGYDQDLLLSAPYLDARTGNLIVEPKPAAVGTGNVTIVLHDTGGTERGGVDTSISATFRVTVQSSPLRVSQFTDDANGFDTDFNDQLDLTSLNLYDAEAAEFGAPDVLVTKDGVAVAGSLIIDPSTKHVTFLKTGGPLDPGTYTVVVRSGTAAFHDRNDRPLNGVGGGTTAGDYTAVFVVPERPANTVTVSLPDFVRGPGQPVNIPATGSGLPIRISDGTNVKTVTFNLRYDPSLLTISGANLGPGLSANAGVTLNQLEPGLVCIVFHSPLPLGAGPVTFATLTAAVPTIAADGIYLAKDVLDIQDLVVTDGTDNTTIPSLADDGLHLVAYPGDVTGNGLIAAQDAAQVARLAAALDTGFGATPCADPVVVGDVSNNGRINAADAAFVAQAAARMTVGGIPIIPGGLVSDGTHAPDPRLRLDADVIGRPGEAVTVPVYLDSVVDLQAPHRLIGATLVLGYDPQTLTYVADSVAPGSFITSRVGWEIIAVNDRVPGRFARGLPVSLCLTWIWP
jgi:hypothetical protein